MSDRMKLALEAGLALSDEERAQLAEALLASLHDDSAEQGDVDWGREIQRRAGSVASGEAVTFPASEVLRVLRAGRAHRGG
jgi:hypothetical protein